MLKRVVMKDKLAAGFALPTVIIVSVVMMIVLLAGLTSSTSITSNITEQYVESVAKDTARAGLVMAQECIKENEYDWTVLRTGDTCDGSTSHCTTADCYVVNDPAGNQRTWFEISAPTLEGGYFKVKATGHYEKLRASNSNSVAQTVSMEYQARVPSPYGGEIRELSLGHRTMCVATTGGAAYCLGGNTDLTLGVGRTSTTYTALRFERLTSGFGTDLFTDVSVGSSHACGVAGGKAYCWGRNDDGALGIGSGTCSNNAWSSPQAVNTSGVLNGKTLTKIVAFGTQNTGCLLSVYQTTCALDTTGKAYCWGADGHYNGSGILDGGGQLGNGNPIADSNVPVEVAGTRTYKDIDGGSWHTCAIGRGPSSSADDGELFCWGANYNGQLGNGGDSSTYQTSPAAVVGPAWQLLNPGPYNDFVNEKFKQVSSGQAHNCAVTTTGELWCWGQNNSGQLGNGSANNNSTRAVKIALPSGQTAWDKVAAGNYWTCAIAKNLADVGKAYCWGTGPSLCGYTGWVGDGVGNSCRGNVTTPTAVDVSGVMNGVNVVDIWAGSYDAIAKDDDGNFYGWGWGGNGLLGNETDHLNLSPYRWSPIESTHITSFNAADDTATGTPILY